MIHQNNNKMLNEQVKYNLLKKASSDARLELHDLGIITYMIMESNLDHPFPFTHKLLCNKFINAHSSKIISSLSFLVTIDYLSYDKNNGYYQIVKP